MLGKTKDMGGFMMKCKICGKEFESSSVKHSEPYDRGDGVMYGTSSYSHNPVCPYCGHDNTVKIFMVGRGKYGI